MREICKKKKNKMWKDEDKRKELGIRDKILNLCVIGKKRSSKKQMDFVKGVKFVLFVI